MSGSAPRRQRRSALALALGLPAALVVVQQQLLVRLPPRVERIHAAPASAGPAAVQVRFSRPMHRPSVATRSRLHPGLPHRWLGEGDRLMLAIEPGVRIGGPLVLEPGGRDLRGLPLAPGRWRWDPRARLLAVVPVAGGEQLQVREHDGRWRPLSPRWPRIPSLEPLPDGSGVGVVSDDGNGRMRAWRIPIRQRDPLPATTEAPPPGAAPPEPLGAGNQVFAHLSGNRRGELLLQTGGLEPASARTVLWSARGRPRRLDFIATGPMRLLPEGGAVVVPASDGLTLRQLPPRPARTQTLPGSRDLSSFCPRAGRALLVRHWPDFRRSLELVEPGQPPRQLWIGPQALVASACAGGGERIWALLVEGVGRPEMTLIALDRRGRLLRRRRLPQLELEPGTGLHHDPATGRLLAALRPLAPADRPAQPARPMLIDADSLELQPLTTPVRQAMWLPAG
jgi:hypothetical protein